MSLHPDCKVDDATVMLFRSASPSLRLYQFSYRRSWKIIRIMGKRSRTAKARAGLNMTEERSANSSTNTLHTTASSCNDTILPTMIVFDLDDCLWHPEMHELPSKPTIPVEGPLDPLHPATSPLGTIGLRCCSSSTSRRRGGGFGWGSSLGDDDDDDDETTVYLYDGARQVLRELAQNPRYQGILLAAASSSLEPSYSRACLQQMEILPDVTMDQLFGPYQQIGRTGHLTSRKTTHFRALHESLQEQGMVVSYEEMLFFDDCNWGDHVGDLERTLGVVGQRTPRGLTFAEFEQGLAKYHQKRRSQRRQQEQSTKQED